MPGVRVLSLPLHRMLSAVDGILRPSDTDCPHAQPLTSLPEVTNTISVNEMIEIPDLKISATDLFLDDCRSRDLSIKTIERYEWALNRLALGQSPVPEDASELGQVLDMPQAADTTRHSLWRALMTFYRWREREHGTPNPMAGLVAPVNPPRLPRIYTEDETAAIVRAAMSERDRTMIEVILDTGISLHELATLTRDVLRPTALTIKGRRTERTVPLSSRLWHQLRSLGDGHHVWLGAKGPLVQSGVAQAIRRTIKSANLPSPRGGPQALRHTFACRYLQCGGSTYDLQRILGHADSRTSLMYAEMADLDNFPPRPRRRSRVAQKTHNMPANRDRVQLGSFISAEHAHHGGLFDLRCSWCRDWTQSYCLCVTWQDLISELQEHRDTSCPDTVVPDLPDPLSDDLRRFHAVLKNRTIADQIAKDDPHFWEIRTWKQTLRN